MSESSPHLAGSPQKMALGELVAETGWFSAETSLTVYRSGYRDVEQPETSFIVPVFNQADVIAEHLTAIRTNARSRHEVIVIVDGCTDGTLREVLAWQHDVDLEGSDRRTCGVTVVEIGEGIFETLSDSVGAALATGTYLVEVQADMLIEDPGFDMGCPPLWRATQSSSSWAGEARTASLRPESAAEARCDSAWRARRCSLVRKQRARTVPLASSIS